MPFGFTPPAKLTFFISVLVAAAAIIIHYGRLLNSSRSQRIFDLARRIFCAACRQPVSGTVSGPNRSNICWLLVRRATRPLLGLWLGASGLRLRSVLAHTAPDCIPDLGLALCLHALLQRVHDVDYRR